jgi:hypothetical protein
LEDRGRGGERNKEEEEEEDIWLLRNTSQVFGREREGVAIVTTARRCCLLAVEGELAS